MFRVSPDIHPMSDDINFQSHITCYHSNVNVLECAHLYTFGVICCKAGTTVRAAGGESNLNYMYSIHATTNSVVAGTIFIQRTGLYVEDREDFPLHISQYQTPSFSVAK